MHFEPIIKWSGSKRSQSESIVKRMPSYISTYYEPFCGGCSVLRQLLETKSITVGKYIASDLNQDLINLWCAIKNDPEYLCFDYERMWNEMNSEKSNVDSRREYFYNVRSRFNEHKRPSDFLFIMRTTTNGMPRYNSNGEFNNSFHLSRKGMDPKRLKKVCFEWSKILCDNNVEFKCMSYEGVTGDNESLTYLDPPYFNTRGMYYGGIDLNRYFEWLKNLNGKWIMSFDGRVNGADLEKPLNFPDELFKSKEYLVSGKSSFRRLIGKSSDTIVEEALYKNF